MSYLEWRPMPRQDVSRSPWLVLLQLPLSFWCPSLSTTLIYKSIYLCNFFSFYSSTLGLERVTSVTYDYIRKIVKQPFVVWLNPQAKYMLVPYPRILHLALPKENLIIAYITYLVIDNNLAKCCLRFRTGCFFISRESKSQTPALRG